MSDGKVVGAIERTDEDEVRFKIIPREGRGGRVFFGGVEITDPSCNHRRFDLDEKWRTARCQDCGEFVDAFGALLCVAEWLEDLHRQRDHAQWARYRLLREELKRFARLRTVTDEEKEAIAKVLHYRRGESLADLPEMSKLVKDIEEARRDRLRKRG